MIPGQVHSRTATALAAVERALAESPDHLTRVRMLPAAVEIMVAAGRVDGARAAADQLTGVAAADGAPVLLASAAGCRGAVLLAEGRPAAALEELRDAERRWQELEIPHEAAQARALLAVACRAVGDHDGARREYDAARQALRALGAAPALTRLEGVSGGFRGGRRRGLGVTPRELDVLRLVAAGRTNREIATQLVISEKTVERHLSNIFARLELPNRAAATAYAYAHDLV